MTTKEAKKQMAEAEKDGVDNIHELVIWLKARRRT